METMKCLTCVNNTKFIIAYIDRTMTTFNEHGDVEREESVSYQSYDDERIICGLDTCGSNNLNIYKEN